MAFSGRKFKGTVRKRDVQHTRPRRSVFLSVAKPYPIISVGILQEHVSFQGDQFIRGQGCAKHHGAGQEAYHVALLLEIRENLVNALEVWKIFDAELQDRKSVV